MSRCPNCHKPAASRGENASFPFCSERCKLVDLGKWLSGAYRIPTAPPVEGEGEDPLVAPREEDDPN
jgi:uncharacterized protein